MDIKKEEHLEDAREGRNMEDGHIRKIIWKMLCRE